MATETSSPPFLVVILDKYDASTETRVIQDAFRCNSSSTTSSSSSPLPPSREVVVKALGITTQEEAMTNEFIPQADAVMVWHTILMDPPLLARMKNARVLVRVGVGYDNCHLQSAAEFGIPICNIPNYGTEEVADHAMSLILCMFRRTAWVAALAATGKEARGSDGVAALARGTRRIRGQVLGIVGMGRIGTATALRAKPFGFDIVFYDPYIPAGIEKALGVRRVFSLLDLAKESNIISIHCDLNPSSRNIINANFLHSMKPHSFIVNTARGGIIVEQDLREALESGHMAGAGIDVHEIEPFVGTTDPKIQPLALAPNCICTPHTAFYSDESFEEMRSLAGKSAADALLGIPLVNVVNAKWLPKEGEESKRSSGNSNVEGAGAGGGGGGKLRASIARKPDW